MSHELAKEVEKTRVEERKPKPYGGMGDDEPTRDKLIPPPTVAVVVPNSDRGTGDLAVAPVESTTP